jgi:hypothetical protein
MKHIAVPAILLVSLFICASSVVYAQGLFINEFMAANSHTIADPDYHEYADWFEVYNAADSSINLIGYSVTDLLSQAGKFRFTTDIIVSPHSFVLIWADDRNTGRHANFKLSASGESIGLFDPAGKVVDTVSFAAQEDDISSGRWPDGSSTWYRFWPASPGSANTDLQIYDRLVPPVLSQQGGFSAAPLTVALSHPASGVILRYTRDGHTPTPSSPQYGSPLRFDSTGVLRVRAFKTGSLPSAIVTATFLLNEKTELPVFSLVTDPENFFSDTAGIYVEGTRGIIAHCSTAPRNWNQEWERPADLQLFDRDRTSGFHNSLGVQIFGGCSRLYPEKSLAFYFRDEYGEGRLRYRLFEDLCLTEYNNFILRSGGQDWWRTMFREDMVHMLIKQGMCIDYQDYRPSILFINGQYWGIHNIREKYNEHYLHYRHGVAEDSIDLIEISQTGIAHNGDLVAYTAMMQFIASNDMSVQRNYDSVRTMADIDDYIDYTIAEIYAANGDWPGSNMKLWRERKPTGKWRWLVYDLDFTFGGNANGLYSSNTLALATATNGPSWPNPPWSTLMLRKLLTNVDFKNEFIQRFAVHTNTTFEEGHVISIIDSLMQGIASEIPRHKLRWPQSLSIGTTWPENVQIMRDFAKKRQSASMGHFMSYFGLRGVYSLTLGRNDSTWGKIFAHNLELRRNGFAHLLFQNVPVKLKAMSMPGYRFVRWEGTVSSTAPETTFVFTENARLTAVFEAAPLSTTAPVINEINYKSAELFDTEDWVELYNPSSVAVDLGGWQFAGESSTTFRMPSGTVLQGKGYLVICRDTLKFKSLRPEVKGILGNAGFGLSSSGERIRLSDPAGTIVDEVVYAPQGAWVSAPNGTGPTLSLINPQKDNALAENWRASRGYGTPGAMNDVYLDVEEATPAVPGKFALFQNYPNPFNPSSDIRYQISEFRHVKLAVYDLLGREVAILVNEQEAPGSYTARWNADGLASGVYICRLKAGAFVESRKMILAR